MQLYKPRSILQLTITGFLLVSGILIVTLIITIQELDGLSRQSQRMINQSAAAMGASRVLLEQASAMERNARQYSILGDAEILEVYSNRRETFSAAAQQLRELNPEQELKLLLDELVMHEELAFSGLQVNDPQSSTVTYFPQLIEVAYRLSYFVNDWINDQSAAIQQETEETKQLLAMQSGILVSIALVLAGVFTVLITSPLLQIETAINQLGSGLYKKSISIKGPKDLVNLGDRLDWLRSRLGKLEQQRTSFLRHVSHELKTPLASMQESSALLRDGVVGKLSKEQEEIIQIQNNNCKRLQALIDNLLRYNSESFVNLNSIPEPFRLDRVVENVLAAHELTLKTCKLQINSKLEKVNIKGNEEQLRVVIDNLVTNAIKFSPQSGHIEINLRQVKGGAEFTVKDEGPGVPKTERKKIFEAFYQSANTRDKHDKGTGLGLAIALEYVQANGGKIELLPCPRGAHFCVFIPFSQSDEA